MTMTCSRCDVISIIWRKTQMAQKRDREKGVGGGRWGICEKTLNKKDKEEGLGRLCRMHLV